MTELEKIANRSWEENNTISIETDNEDAYKAGYITGFKKCFELNEGVEVENERLKAIILGNEEEISKLENESLISYRKESKMDR